MKLFSNSRKTARPAFGPLRNSRKTARPAFALAGFLFRRALHSSFVLFCVSLLSLTLVKLTPGDFFESARVDPSVSPNSLEAMRAREGLDASLPVLYWSWLRSCVRGDWGYSFAYNTPAAALLKDRIRNTFVLMCCATLLAWMIALPAGVIAGARQGGPIDLLVSSGTMVLLAIPELVLALAVLLIAASFHSPLIAAEGSPYSARTFFPPVICLTAGLLPLLLLHIKASVSETAQTPFVSAARSFAISPSRVLLRWILPASSNAMISLFGLSLGLLLSSSLIVEGVFSWPGLGSLMLRAIGDRDIFLIVDSAVIAASFLLIGNLAADALLYLSDPRIRAN